MKKGKTSFLHAKSATTILLFTTIISLIYYLWGINSWKFAFAGDDWPFYEFAVSIAQKNFMINPFDLHGVYGENPVLGSVYQAVFLKILGYTNFAWRFSNLVLIVPVTIFFYLFVKEHFSTSVALFATILLQSSFYLANISKIGYVNPQSFALFIVALYLAGKLGKKLSLKYSVLLGITLGVSFYIYIGPLFPLFIWSYLLPVFFKKYPKLALLKHFLLIVFFYLLIILPGLMTLDKNYISEVVPSVKNQTDKDSWKLSDQITQNFLVFYKDYDTYDNHFISAPGSLDMMSGILAAAGAVYFLINWRKKAYGTVFIAYLTLCVVLAATNSTLTPKVTRIVFFLPSGVIFAAVILDMIQKKFKGIYLGYILLFVICLLNIYQSQAGVFERTGYTGTALLIKNMQDQKTNGDKTLVQLLISDGYSYWGYIPNLAPMRQAYGLEDIPFEITAASRFSCSMLNNGNVYLFAYDREAINRVNDSYCPAGTKYSVMTLEQRIPHY